MMFLKILFIFALFSIVGWILEVIYRSLMVKKFVNPGFMTGCVVPIYGFGAIILNIICSALDGINSNNKILIIFLVSFLSLTLLEFISGYVLYKFMHVKLWDYSNYKFNYKGFICLRFSIIWGVCAFIFYFLVYPWINEVALSFTSNIIGIFFLGIYSGIFLVDLGVSINLLKQLVKYAKDIKEIVDLEKLKLTARMKVRRKKFLNAIYPYVSINRFLKEKIKR